MTKEAWLVSATVTTGGTPTSAAGTEAVRSNLGTLPTAVGFTAPSSYAYTVGPRPGKGLAFTAAATGGATMRLPFPTSTDPSWVCNILFETPATNPTAAATFLDNRNSGTTVIFRLQWSATGQILLTDSGSVQRIALAATNFTASTIYRIEVLCVGQSTTAGQITLNVRNLAGTLVATGTTAVANMTTTSAAFMTLGATGVAWNYRLFEPQTSTASTTEIGLYSYGATVANAGVDQTNIEPYTTVSLAATDDGTGSPVRTWSQTAGTTVTLTQTGQTATFTAPGTIAGTTLTFQYQADTITDTMTVAVLPVTERAVSGGGEVPMQILAVSS